MRPYARHPTRNGGVFFAFYFFLGGWARRSQAYTTDTRIAIGGGEGGVGPKGTSTKPILNIVSHKFLDTIYSMWGKVRGAWLVLNAY